MKQPAYLLAIATLGTFSASTAALGFVPHGRIAPTDKTPNRLALGHPGFSTIVASSQLHVCRCSQNNGGVLRHHCSIFSTRGGAEASSKKDRRRGLDLMAVAKYAIGFGVQLSVIYGIFTGIDKIVAKLALKVPFYAKFMFFYLFNTKTGTFNPLQQKGQPKDKNFQKPSWTPPGYVFAFMWPIFVFGIRAATASMIVSASGGVFATSTLMSLMFHLGFGNWWNTVNNVERRLGFSVPVLYGLLFSNLYASYRFFLVDPLAGKLLVATSIWLAAAAALETNAWLINPDSDTGKPEPLYPAKDSKWTTKFRWES